MDEDGEDQRERDADADASYLLHEIKKGRAHFPECPVVNLDIPEELRKESCVCFETLVELEQDPFA